MRGGGRLYGYVHDPSSWLDVFGLAACHDSGERGSSKARNDIEDAGLKIIGEEVLLDITGKKSGSGNIKIDYLAIDPKTGQLYGFESKNGNSGYTNNQTKSNLFDKNRVSNLDKKGGAGLDLNRGKVGEATIKAGKEKVGKIERANNGLGDLDFT